MKFCKKCKVEKDLSEFGIDKSKKDNLSIYCKDCLKTTREKYKGKYDHKEYYGEYKPKRKEYYQNIKHNKSFYKDNKQKTREIYIQEGILKKQSILESLIKQPIDKKICSKCKNEKEFDEFKKYKKSKDGYYYQCKTCQKESNKKSYEKNKEKLNQKKKQNENVLILFGIYINPEYRNKGLCRDILYYLIDKIVDFKNFKYICVQSVLSKILYEYLLRFTYKNKKFKLVENGFLYKL